MAKLCGWAIALLALLPATLAAQQPQENPVPAVATLRDGAFNQVLQAGCSSCGAGMLGAGAASSYLSGDCSGDDCEGGCFPGRKNCVPCVGQNCISRMFCAFHDCLCCPDPCYEPRWIGAANAAFFVDAARPISQTRIRWDSGRNMILPDRAEYFWARIGGKGPGRRETGLNYNELTLYSEAATERFSAFTEMPYRQLDPNVNNGASGFGDLKIGTKSLLLDCELIQLSLQFTTAIPIGAAGKGLGTGHVSLEPSLLAAIKLYPETYLQAQLAQWIPIGGTQGFQGGVLHYHFSLNHVICRPIGDTQLVGTMEFNGYTFQSGSFTDPVLGVQRANGSTYVSVGPGLRYIICDKVDIGVGTAFSVTGQHFADQLYRTEFRWRF
ncbi:MAG: hypothetical protein K8T89_01540 [Planctomycetes bacterium]|nr:hypothetical protein [Planctomycetota bacterium]